MTTILPVPQFFPSLIITPFSEEALGAEMSAFGQTAPSENVYSSANRAHYIPFSLRSPATVRKVFWVNGTVANGNTDVGILASTDGKPSTLLLSTGSTAQTGTSTLQVTDTTDLTLAGGVLYYMALAHSNTTGRFHRISNPAVAVMNMIGVCQATTALPLVSNPTIAAIATAYIPIFGLVFDTSAVL